MDPDQDLKMIVQFLSQQLDQIKVKKEKVQFLEQCVSNLLQSFQHCKSLNLYLDQLIQKLEKEYEVDKNQNHNKQINNQQEIKRENGVNNYDNLLKSVIKTNNLSSSKIERDEDQNDLNKYKQMLQRLTDTNTNFIDSEFKHCLNSISTDVNKQQKYREYNNWYRVKDIINNQNNRQVYLFNEFSEVSVKQGYLGNCYILASLSAIMVNHPEYIFRLFQSNTNTAYCKYGIYTVKLCIDGKWKNIIIDDYFPCDRHKQPIFAKPYKDEIWVMLLEKAIAKAYKSYQNLEQGLSQFAMNLLTGAPSKGVSFDNNMNKLFTMINDYHNQHFLITTSTGSNEGYDQNQIMQSHIQGFQKRHAYTIVDVYCLDLIKRIKLRNPWGDGNKIGSNKVINWNGCQIVNHRKSCQSSEAWIDFDQFIAIFNNFDINKLNQNYHEKYLRFKNFGVNQTKFIQMTVQTDNYIYLSLFQKNSRSISNFEGYWRIYMIIYKYDSGVQQWVLMESKCRADHQITMEYKYPKGKYLIQIQCKASDEMNNNQIVSQTIPYITLKSYSQQTLELQETQIDKYSIVQFYQNISFYVLQNQSAFVFKDKYPVRTVEWKTGCIFVYVIQNIHNSEVRVMFKLNGIRNIRVIEPPNPLTTGSSLELEMKIESMCAKQVVMIIESDKGDYSYTYNYQVHYKQQY